MAASCKRYMKFQDEFYYHVYNRGSRKGNIFFAESNYEYFVRLFTNNSSRFNVDIIAYCLMPNHYHFIIIQNTGGSISKMLQCTMNSYVQAINKTYSRSGSLFQGKPQSVHIENDGYLVHLVRYIHRNPLEAGLETTMGKWKYSDYTRWIIGPLHEKSCAIRDSYFLDGNAYKQFVEGYKKDSPVNLTKYVLE
ncbi:MAG: transposase [Bacteroidota bacterium]